MDDNIQISIVIPAYNEEESLPELCAWIERVTTENNFTYEVLIIDDGSTDNSWPVIQGLNDNNRNIKGIRFNRNYGKSAALNVGFKNAHGAVVITMDADLQDSPDEIPGLYKMVIQEGYDVVSGWKKKRYDPISKTIPSRLFNSVTAVMSGIKLHDFNCGLKAYNCRVTKSLEIYGEMHRYIPILAKWDGYVKIGEKIVQHRPRKYGVTKFGLERFIFGFLDLLSITFVSRFKKRPMHFFGSMGILSFLIGIFISFGLIGQKIYDNINGKARNVTDQWYFFIALVAVIVGVQLFLAGFIGEMITQSSGRKNDYVVSEKAGI
jgi:glycosyltransferase involved in cell wall biosynthesis